MDNKPRMREAEPKRRIISDVTVNELRLYIKLSNPDMSLVECETQAKAILDAAAKRDRVLMSECWL